MQNPAFYIMFFGMQFITDYAEIYPIPYPTPENSSDFHKSQKWSGQKGGWAVHPYGDTPGLVAVIMSALSSLFSITRG